MAESEPVVIVAEHTHGEVGITATQVDRGVGRHHVDAQVREPPTQRYQGAHHVLRKGIGRRHTHGSDRLAARPAHRRRDGKEVRVEPSRDLGHRAPGLRQRHPLGHPHGELRIGRLLERHDPPADRRRVHAKRARRGREPPRVRHGQQELEIVPVHEIPRQ